MNFFKLSLFILYHTFIIPFSCIAQCPSAGYILGNESWTSSGSFNPTIISNGASASGGTGTISYKWQESTDLGITWTDISGAITTTYNPNTITQTTWYRRLAKTPSCATWQSTNAVRKAIVSTTANNAAIQVTRSVGNISKCSSSGATKTSMTFSIEGIKSNGDDFTHYHHVLMPGATIVENCDGTATISGRVCASNGRGSTPENACFDFVFNLSGRTTTLPLGKTAVTGCDNTNTSNWYYYAGSNDGTLRLIGVAGTDYEGAVVIFYGNEDHYFQIGDGAAYHIDGKIGGGIWGDIEVLDGGINNLQPKNDGQEIDFQMSIGDCILNTIQDTVCKGSNAAIAVNTTGCPGANYSWIGPNSFTSSVRNPTIATTALPIGLNYYHVTVSSAGLACSSTSFVFVKGSPTLTAAANSVCVGSNINFNASASNQIISYNSTTNELVSNNASNFDNTCTNCFSSDVPTNARGYTDNPENINNNWVNTGDHTSGSGNMYYFNDNTNGTNRRQWYNTYTVTSNTTYKMSFWTRNILNGGNSPTLFWTVNNVQVDSFMTPHYINGWVYYEATWYAANQTGNIVFAIVLHQNDTQSDFVLDDISIQEIALASTTNTSTAETYAWSGPASFNTSVQNPSRTNATLAMDGIYNVTFTSSNGCNANTSIDVTVNSAPSINTQPTNASVCSNGTQNLSIVASGGVPNLLYNWQYYNGSSWVNVNNGIPSNATYSGNNSNTLTINAITISNTYQYRVSISASGTGCGSLTSNIATLTVVSPPNAGNGGTTTLCKAEYGTNNTNLLSLLSGYSANNGTWQSISTPSTMNTTIINSKISGNILLRNGLPIGTYVFRYTLVGNNPCPNDTENVSVIIQPCCSSQFCVPILSKKN